MSIKATLGKLDLTMIVVSLVIGIGIFRSPAIVAEKAGSETLFFAAWILGGLISICGALTFAEIGSRLPVAGGFYKIFSACYHPVFAFMLNWSLVVINAFSCVGVALVGAEYISPLVLPEDILTNGAIRMVAFIMIAVLFILNFAGIKTGARAQNILSSIKILMILFFSSLIFFHSPSESIQNATSVTAESSPQSITGLISLLGISLIAVFFTYGGYQNTINFGEDAKNPQHNIPASILMGMGIVMVLYLSINIAYVSVLGFEKVQHSKLIASELISNFFGVKGFAIASVAIFISVMGYLNTSLLYNPRIYYAMADDGILPSAFKKINSRTQVQEFALSFFTALMIIGLLWLGTFEKIINYVMFIDSFGLATAAATIFILRNKMKHSSYTGFRLRFFPFIPIVFVIVLLSVTYHVFMSDINSAMGGICLFAGGFPLYHILKKFSKRKHTNEA